VYFRRGAVVLAGHCVLLCVNVTQLLLTRASQTLRYKLGSSHRVARCPVRETRISPAGVRVVPRETSQ